ncbi:aldo-keto reductase family 1 member B1-like [Brevipalpus obovatus]|uniref:aldo-keto reductase family 1 member B1-like n=1 Tax=Brevipalpus obovatus TaxID=246614 RepID=UPI003D9E6D89
MICTRNLYRSNLVVSSLLSTYNSAHLPFNSCPSISFVQFESFVNSLCGYKFGSLFNRYSATGERKFLSTSVKMVVPAKSGTLTLADGKTIPQFGLGTWKSKPGEVRDAVYSALTEAGYRHIDCAHVYGNEKEVGEALKQAFSSGELKREDVFITSKVWNTYHSRNLVMEACKVTLKNLGLDYLDLYLIHWPMGYKEGGEEFPRGPDGKSIYSDVDFLDTWKGMEDCHKAGLVKSIGVSNFNSEQLQRVLDNSSIKPVMNQVEVHPYLANEDLIKFCKERKVLVTAYSPLGSPDRPWAKAGDPSLMDEPKIQEIAKRHNKTAAQVLLRWPIQRGIVVIPKSVTKARIAENIDIFDFELNEEEMKTISAFNRGWRACALGDISDHPHYPFNIKF